MAHRVRDLLTGWRDEDLQNLASLVDKKYKSGQHVTPDQIEEAFKWQYHNRSTEGGKTAAKRAWEKVKSGFGAERVADKGDQPEGKLLYYETLLRAACKHEKALEEGATIPELEVYLAQAIILRALQHMKPKKRAQFFEQEIEVEKLTGDAKIKGPKLGGPMTTFAMLGAAQASGFGVYLAATTALGFVTHAVNVTLPFAVYSGMTSTIAFVIGPAGWLAAGAWGLWKVSQPRWKRIIPGLMYLTAVNARNRLEEDGEPGVVAAV